MMTPSGLMVNWVNLPFLFCCDEDALLLHGYTFTSTWASRRELISLAGLMHRAPLVEEAAAVAEGAEEPGPTPPVEAKARPEGVEWTPTPAGGIRDGGG